MTTAPVAAPDFYRENVARHYDRLVDWVIQDWQEPTRARIGEFVQRFWSARRQPVREVLEICCGTGLMLHELVRRGYRVAGLDQSAPMLGIARERLGPDVPLTRGVLPDIPVNRRFDAVLSAGAGLTYLPPGQLSETLCAVARALEPGGTFVFDTLSATMLREHMPARFAGNTLATDLGDTAFIWEFATAASGEYSDLNYIQFVQEDDAAADGPYRRVTELHRMYVHERDQVRELARNAGFVDVSVTDGYTTKPAGPDTLNDSWTMTLSQARVPDVRG